MDFEVITETVVGWLDSHCPPWLSHWLQGMLVIMILFVFTGGLALWVFSLMVVMSAKTIPAILRFILFLIWFVITLGTVMGFMLHQDT